MRSDNLWSKGKDLVGEEATVACFMVFYRHLRVILGESMKNLSARAKNGTDHI